MAEERIWMKKAELIELEYEIDRKSWDVLPLVKQLATLVEKHIGFVTHVVAGNGNDNETFEGDLGQKEFYEYIQQNKENLVFIELNVTLNCRDEQGNPIKIPEGLELQLFIHDDYYALYVVVNTDIYAPFYKQKSERSERLARANFPFLKNFIRDTENTIPGKWVEVLIAPIMEDYFEEVGFEIGE